MSGPPGGKPIPGVTNLGDIEWMLTKLRRWVFDGGDTTDPRYRAQINVWLDYRNDIAWTRLEQVGDVYELAPALAAAPADTGRSFMQELLRANTLYEPPADTEGGAA